MRWNCGVRSAQAVEKLLLCHCEERFSRRGNLERIDLFNGEIALFRSQRRLKDFSTAGAVGTARSI